MGDAMSPGEHRLTRGCDNLLRSCGTWLGAADVDKHRTRAAAGRAIGGTAAAWFAGGLLYELGPIAWSASGALLALSVWVAGAPAAEEEQEEEQPDIDGMEPDAFVELVRDVADGRNVHLTEIGRQLMLETGRDWDVLALCRQAGITTKAVRVPGADPAVTTGIHRADLPPLPHRSSTTPEGVLTSNNNSNNTTATETTEGVVIITTGPSIHQEAHS